MAGKAKPSSLLQRALKLFGKKGERWMQSDEEVGKGGTGYIRNKRVEFPDGAFCAIGVVHKVNTNRESEAAHYLALVIAPQRVAGGDEAETVITDWNDSNKRTFAQVRAMFQKAIKLAKSLGQ